MSTLTAADVRSSRDRTRRRALIVAVAVFIVALVVQIALGPRTAWQWSIALAGYAWFRLVRVNRVIVWLRRFHLRDPNRLRFNRVLGSAALGLGVAVTIQDSSYKTSYEQSFARSVWFYPFVIALTIVPLLGGFLAAFLLGASARVGIVVALPLLGAYAYGVKRFLDRRGVTVLSGSAGLKKAQAELASMRAGKRSSLGVRVCACEDAIWKQVVECYIRGADAVVVDVTDMSENVVWELKTAAACVGPGSLLLACGYDGDAPQQLPTHVSGHIERAIPSARLTQLPVFLYPKRAPRVGFGARAIYKIVTEALSDQLTHCLAARDQVRGESAGRPA